MSDSIDEQIDSMSWEKLKITRDYENGFDAIHTLFPFLSNNFEYALPIDSSPRLRFLTHCFFQSIDRKKDDIDIELFQELYKNKENDPPLSKEYLIADSIVTWIMSTSKQFAKEIDCNNEKRAGLIVAVATLLRLVATFQAASVLIKDGFHCETIYLFRVILEQIAYAYKCSTITVDDEIKKIQAQKCISELKNIHKEAGRMNGLFSNYIHHHADTWNSFIKQDTVQDLTFVINRSGKESKKNVIFLLSLSVIYFDVIYDIYKNNADSKSKDFLSKLVYIDKLHKKAKRDLRNIYVPEEKA